MRVLLISVVLLLVSFSAMALQVGAEQTQRYKELLAKKNLALVVNQTSRVGKQHLIDHFLAQDLQVKTIFALEHGVRGDVENGGQVIDGVDAATGLPVISLYGGKYGPDKQDLAGIDVVVFDIQDVGVRYYTYISSLFYLMQACATYDVPLLVLDRPNPLIAQVAGPMLEPKFKSFVGLLPIPLVHGMTVAELAQMINGEGWLEENAICDLTVISVADYHRGLAYSLPVKPSPNLPNDLAINLYPSLGLFEGTSVSVGRGTDLPFQIVGHPLDRRGELYFTPVPKPGASNNPPHQGVSLRGDDLRDVARTHTFSISLVLDWYNRLGASSETFFTRAAFFDKLAGTDQLRKAIIAGKSADQINDQWLPAIETFKRQRQAYLLYPETEPL